MYVFLCFDLIKEILEGYMEVYYRLCILCLCIRVCICICVFVLVYVYMLCVCYRN